MIALVVTGGIATGKSTFCRELRTAVADSILFDCDRSVHALLTTPDIIAKVKKLFGESVLDESGEIDRSQLRDQVFKHLTLKRALEQLLHPEVRRLCNEARLQALEHLNLRIFVADVPLFFENHFPMKHDFVLTVATTQNTQMARLLRRSPHLSQCAAEKIIDAQLPISKKVAASDFVIWNDGAPASMKRQLELFLLWMDLHNK